MVLGLILFRARRIKMNQASHGRILLSLARHLQVRTNTQCNNTEKKVKSGKLIRWCDWHTIRRSAEIEIEGLCTRVQSPRLAKSARQAKSGKRAPTSASIGRVGGQGVFISMMLRDMK
jgi:hypothetical protein